MKVAAAGGADVMGGCARMVFCAISFHFVTSLAWAAAGETSATAAPRTASQRIRLPLIVLSPLGAACPASGSAPWCFPPSSPAQGSNGARYQRGGGGLWFPPL